jgi:hypothetical protein
MFQPIRLLPILLLCCQAVFAAEARYLGLTPPDTPQPFDPPEWSGIGRSITNVAFAPGHRHVVMSVMDADPAGKVAGAFHESRLRRGEWSPPRQVVALIAGPSSGEGWFTPDGRWFYFSSDRPPGGPWRPRAFRAEVRRGQIAAPALVELEVPEAAGVYYPRVLANGGLSFTSRGSNGRDDLFVAPARGRGFGKPEALAGDFNSPRDDWDLVESSDGTLRIWVSAREGGVGLTDLYFSRRDRAGAWSPARGLAAANTSALETAPTISPDDRVLFFLRRVDGRERLYWIRLAKALEGS